MEIDNVQVVKPFGPLILIAQLPEGVIKPLNEIVDVIKDRKDMGARLAGVIETESEIPHSMLEEKKVMNIFHALSRSYLEQAYLNAGLAIKECEHEITSGEEAMKLKGIGKSSASLIDKVLEEKKRWLKSSLTLR